MRNKLICIFFVYGSYKIALCDCDGLDHCYTYGTSTNELASWEIGQMMGGN
jgi:hypothetical protein